MQHVFASDEVTEKVGKLDIDFLGDEDGMPGPGGRLAARRVP